VGEQLACRDRHIRHQGLDPSDPHRINIVDDGAAILAEELGHSLHPVVDHAHCKNAETDGAPPARIAHRSEEIETDSGGRP
jgi:hypothetical protein